jgi:hypothetical protein
MLHFVFQILARLSPKSANIARESYYTLNGWRFEDLKCYIDTKSSAPTLALDYTLRIAREGASENQRVAFISCLPPLETGIGTCSFYSWLNYSGPVDIFAPIVDSDWFFGLERMLRGDGSGPRLFDVAGFLSMDKAVGYTSIIIAVGNSNHNLYIFDLLKKLHTFGTLDRVTFLIHDPCLLNLIQRGAGLSALQLYKTLDRIYEHQLPAPAEEIMLHRQISTAGIMGLRYFCNMGVKRYLVNSAASAELVRGDLRDTNASITQIFHPVFLPMNSEREEHQPLPDDRIVIGVYGVPSFDKGISIITEAIRNLNKSGIATSLILAGFHAGEFVEKHEDLFREFEKEVFDSPTDVELVNCMRKCHIAVQLRTYTLGESSGIIPQLLMLEKDIIVTATGSFVEYGEAVHQVPVGITGDQLAGEIVSLRDNPISTAIKERYVSSRSPEQFQRMFESLFIKTDAKRAGDNVRLFKST